MMFDEKTVERAERIRKVIVVIVVVVIITTIVVDGAP